MADENSRRDDPGSWILSRDYDRAVKDRRRTLILGSIGLLVSTLTWVSPLLDYKEAPNLIATGLAWFALAAVTAFFRYYTAERRYQAKQESPGPTASATAPDFADERRRHRVLMNKNYLMYGNQARNSDRNSQAAMILGLLILTGAAVALLLVKSRSAQVVVSGLGVVGAAYSAYISKTFITVRESSLERQDHVFSLMALENRFLDAERLIHDISISESERQALMKKVLRARLKSIQSLRDETSRAGERPSISARRKTTAPKKLTRGNRRTSPDNRLPVRAVQPRPGRQEAMEMIQALLLAFGIRLSSDGEAWPADDDEEEPPAP